MAINNTVVEIAKSVILSFVQIRFYYDRNVCITSPHGTPARNPALVSGKIRWVALWHGNGVDVSTIYRKGAGKLDNCNIIWHPPFTDTELRVLITQKQ